MIKPLLQDDALLADVDAAKSDRPNFRLWWLGQSGFLVQFNGRHALLDPYLSDSLTVKYAQTDKPHVRMTERVIAPERLGFVDVVTSSHGSTDPPTSRTSPRRRHSSGNAEAATSSASSRPSSNRAA